MGDAEAVRKQRLSQVEEKRKKLEELRKRRKNEKEGGGTSASAAPIAPAAEKKESELRAKDDSKDLDELVKGLLGTAPVGLSAVEADRNEAPAAASSEGATAQPYSAQGPRREVQLSVTEAFEILSIAPAHTESYDKQCQTDALDDELEDASIDGTDRGTQPVGHAPRRASQLIPRVNSAAAVGQDNGRVSVQSGLDESEPIVPAPSAQLTEEEKGSIMASDRFLGFMAEKSLVLERALGEASVYDILVDYGGGDAVERRDGSDAIKTLMAFHDKHWCSERAVTDVHWSPHYSELLLASYTAKGQRLDSHGVDSGPVPASTFNGDPDGLLLVWSLASTSRTEMMFQSQSTILAARFHDFDSHLLLGGAYSGQIFLWDTRSKSLPVQRSRLSAEGHTHPVYSLSIVGTSSSHSLATASTDGKVAWWDPRQLDRPVESAQLVHGDGDVAITSMAFGRAEAGERMVVGSESGLILSLPSKTQDSEQMTPLHGHFGMVTSVDVNPSASAMLRGLVLSSSVDWTTKLWHMDKSSRPIMSFSHGSFDYVCDARWSPSHPALFIAANISGEMSLWDLHHSTEEPRVPPIQASTNCALTRVGWSGEGRRIAAGDANGFAHIFSVDEEIAIPRQDDDLRLEHIIESALAAL